jgi:hypothetical protein
MFRQHLKGGGGLGVQGRRADREGRLLPRDGDRAAKFLASGVEPDRLHRPRVWLIGL